MQLYSENIEVLVSFFEEKTIDKLYPEYKSIVLPNLIKVKENISLRGNTNNDFNSQNDVLFLLNILQTAHMKIINLLPQLKAYENENRKKELEEKERKVYYYGFTTWVLGTILIAICSFKLAGYVVKIIEKIM